MRLLLILTICFSCTGCLLEVMTTTAIQGELAAENAQSANHARDRANDTKSKIELESAVRAYSGLSGQYPASLDVLVPNYIPALPLQSNGKSFGYTPSNGTVFIQRDTIGRQAPAQLTMTATDVTNLDALRGAIYRYWETTGRYPPNLESLAPIYIAVVPVMSSGGQFGYDVTRGVVSHPAEASQASAPNRPIGTRAGGDAVGISDAHNQQQQKALDDLGF
jgi:hypothetical protein